MSTGLITELMFNALDSLPVILFTVFHQPLVPVPCFLFSLRTACTWLLRVSSFIFACRSAFTHRNISWCSYFWWTLMVHRCLTSGDIQGGPMKTPSPWPRESIRWMRALSSKWIALVISSQDSKLLQTPVSSLCSVSIFRCSHLWNTQSTCQV